MTVEVHIRVINTIGLRGRGRITYDLSANNSETDLKLEKADGRSLYVNSGYLSQLSSYFAGLRQRLSDLRKDPATGLPTEKLDVDHDDFLNLLLVVYPSKKAIQENDVSSLLPLADRFLFEGVLVEIERFLITPQSAAIDLLVKLQWAYTYQMADLEERHSKTPIKYNESLCTILTNRALFREIESVLSFDVPGMWLTSSILLLSTLTALAGAVNSSCRLPTELTDLNMNTVSNNCVELYGNLIINSAIDERSLTDLLRKTTRIVGCVSIRNSAVWSFDFLGSLKSIECSDKDGNVLEIQCDVNTQNLGLRSIESIVGPGYIIIDIDLTDASHIQWTCSEFEFFVNHPQYRGRILASIDTDETSCTPEAPHFYVPPKCRCLHHLLIPRGTTHGKEIDNLKNIRVIFGQIQITGTLLRNLSFFSQLMYIDSLYENEVKYEIKQRASGADKSLQSDKYYLITLSTYYLPILVSMLLNLRVLTYWISGFFRRNFKIVQIIVIVQTLGLILLQIDNLLFYQRILLPTFSLLSTLPTGLEISNAILQAALKFQISFRDLLLYAPHVTYFTVIAGVVLDRARLKITRISWMVFVFAFMCSAYYIFWRINVLKVEFVRSSYDDSDFYANEIPMIQKLMYYIKVTDTTYFLPSMPAAPYKPTHDYDTDSVQSVDSFFDTTPLRNYFLSELHTDGFFFTWNRLYAELAMFIVAMFYHAANYFMPHTFRLCPTRHIPVMVLLQFLPLRYPTFRTTIWYSRTFTYFCTPAKINPTGWASIVSRTCETTEFIALVWHRILYIIMLLISLYALKTARYYHNLSFIRRTRNMKNRNEIQSRSMDDITIHGQSMSKPKTKKTMSTSTPISRQTLDV